MIINLALNWLVLNDSTYWRIHRETLDTKMQHDLVTSHHDGSHQLTYVEIIVLTLNRMLRTKVIRFDITFLMCAIESTLWFKVNIVLKVSIEDFLYFLCNRNSCKIIQMNSCNIQNHLFCIIYFLRKAISNGFLLMILCDEICLIEMTMK